MTTPPKTLKQFLSFPKWIVFQLTEKCNLRCRMCYEWGESGSYHEKKDLVHLETHVVKKVIEQCRQGRPYIGLFGGEPLMHPDIIEICKFLHEMGFDYEMPTNGTLLERYAAELVLYKPARLWISLDGPEAINDAQRGKGVYRRVISGIEAICKEREKAGSDLPKIGVTMVVTPITYKHIEDLFLKSLDIKMLDHISIELQLFSTEAECNEYEKILHDHFGISGAKGARGMIWDRDEFKSIDILELIRQISAVKTFCEQNNIYCITYPKTMTHENLKHFYDGEYSKMADYNRSCAFPWIYAEISAKGEVGFCHAFYDFSCGNVYEKEFLEIWSGEAANKFKQYIRKNKLLPICTACCNYFRDPAKI
ncbi:MAG: radical SAM protein [Oligoflexales bacterium]|nr:radical SAM protein [Oligoflexales bacterium]